VALSPQHRKLLFRYVTEQIGHNKVPVPSSIFGRKPSTNGDLTMATARQRYLFQAA